MPATHGTELAGHKSRGPNLRHLDCAWCANWWCCMSHGNPAMIVRYTVGIGATAITHVFCDARCFAEWHAE